MGKASKNPKKNGRRMKVSAAGSHTGPHPHPVAATTAPAAPASAAPASGDFAAAIVDDAPAVSATVTCTHGSVGRDTVAFRERRAAIIEYMKLKNEALEEYRQKNDNDVHSEWLRVEMSFFIDYWSKNSQLADEILIKMAYAKATDYVIRGDYATARYDCWFAANLELLRAKMSEDEEAMLQYAANYKDLCLRNRTERDTIVNLTKLIPCSCLKQVTKQAKKWQATDRCQFCGVEGSQDKFLVCSACKVSGYCSRDCQRAHWKAGHKTACMLLAMANHT
jgi:MYND finger